MWNKGRINMVRRPGDIRFRFRFRSEVRNERVTGVAVLR